jgi:hypothetical protein
MPFHMLGKVAEAQALRKAFPEELGDLYIKEEMDQANDVLPGPVVPEAPAAKSLNEAAKAAPKKAQGQNELERKIEGGFAAFAALKPPRDRQYVLNYLGRKTPAEITADDLRKLAAHLDELQNPVEDQDMVDGEVEDYAPNA